MILLHFTSELISRLQYYWPIDNNSNELISCKDILLPGSSFGSDRFGNVNGAFVVTGLSDHGNIPPIFSLSPSFTVTLWFYANSFISWNRIFDFGQNFYLSYSSYTPGETVFTSVNSQIKGSILITNGTWNHYALSVNGLETYIFINGVFSAYGFLNQTLNTQNIIYGFFGRGVPNGFYANGLFDEIKIFNKALSHYEVIKDKDMQGSYSINNPCNFKIY